MSTDSTNEGSTNNVEGQEQLSIEQLQTKLNELTGKLTQSESSKERILAESKKYKEGYNSYKAEKDAIAEEKAKAEEEALKKKGEFGTLLSQKEQAIADLQAQLQEVNGTLQSKDQAITNFRKAAAFEKEIGGKLRKDSYWSHVDFDNIVINPDTNQIDRMSLSKAAEEFRSDYKELIDFGNVANLPNSSGSSSSGHLTVDQWKQLPLADKKKRMKDIRQ